MSVVVVVDGVPFVSIELDGVGCGRGDGVRIRGGGFVFVAALWSLRYKSSALRNTQFAASRSLRSGVLHGGKHMSDYKNSLHQKNEREGA